MEPAAFEPLKAKDALAIDAAIGTETGTVFRSLYTDVIAGSLIHDISLLRSLLGPITSIDSAAQWGQGADAGSLEFGGTIGNSARVHMHWHYLADYPDYHETVRIHHSTGTLELEFTVPYLLNAPTELRIVARAGAGESRSVVRDVTEAFESELIAFHRLAAEGIAAPTGIAEGRVDLVTALQLGRALAASQNITIGGEAIKA